MGQGSQGSKIIELRADALPGTHARPKCRRCPSELGYLVDFLKSDGSRALRWCCDNCEDCFTAGDHWAPQALFPQWPDLGVYLCHAHHLEWHLVMQQHGLRWPGDIRVQENVEDFTW